MLCFDASIRRVRAGKAVIFLSTGIGATQAFLYGHIVCSATESREDVVTMSEIFTFDRRGIDEEGNVLGRFVSTGVVPRFCERLRKRGTPLSTDYFMPDAGDTTGEYRTWINKP